MRRPILYSPGPVFGEYPQHLKKVKAITDARTKVSRAKAVLMMNKEFRRLRTGR